MDNKVVSRKKIHYRIRKRIIGSSAKPRLNVFRSNADIYACLAFVLVIVAASLFLRDRIPKRFIVPIGIIGWLLTVLLAVGYAFKMQLK